MTLKPILSEEQIRNRIATLSESIDKEFRGRNPLLLGVLKGSVHFLSDLSRSLSIPHEIDFIRVATYIEGTEASSQSRVEHFRSLNVKGRDILVVDEILDQGHTANAIKRFLLDQKPTNLEWVFLLVKEGARQRTGLFPNYVGFEIGENWAVGYGMDLNEAYRHLPGVYELET
ncbi:MAG: hypoxanthine phosphoribosyltransferase [Candidatus Omnitrophica bacterium]|nr:hypoxanthine phosphoribosyltransferase [Candidatus Omnitrophota bacterium]